MRAEVDFQVQALIGTVKLVEARLWGGFNYYEFDGETSRWSETQTLLIGESQTPSPEPTPTPPDVANMHQPVPWVDVILTIAVIVAVVGAGLGLLISLIKRK